MASDHNAITNNVMGKNNHRVGGLSLSVDIATVTCPHTDRTYVPTIAC
jgi:hypothetical protein